MCRAVFLACAFLSMIAATGCSQTSGKSYALMVPSAFKGKSAGSYRASAAERECLARAMFFESHRSSREGMIAVGTVVMNRLETGKWGNSICGVVGAKRQFAPGVLSRPMKSKAMPDVMEAADAVLKGERHPKIYKDVMFFHTAGLKFPYKNMHYVHVAGGNAFYEKRSRKRRDQAGETQLAAAAAPQPATAVAFASEPAPAVPALPEAAPQPPAAVLTAADMAAPDDVAGPVAAFEATPDDASAVGALLLAEQRPLSDY